MHGSWHQSFTKASRTQPRLKIARSGDRPHQPAAYSSLGNQHKSPLLNRFHPVQIMPRVQGQSTNAERFCHLAGRWRWRRPWRRFLAAQNTPTAAPQSRLVPLLALTGFETKIISTECKAISPGHSLPFFFGNSNTNHHFRLNMKSSLSHGQVRKCWSQETP
jgi:hypothetical protein